MNPVYTGQEEEKNITKIKMVLTTLSLVLSLWGLTLAPVQMSKDVVVKTGLQKRRISSQKKFFSSFILSQHNDNKNKYPEKKEKESSGQLIFKYLQLTFPLGKLLH